MSPAEQQTCEGEDFRRRTDFRRFKRRLKRTGPRPDDEHGPRIRFEFHDWAFVCIGSTVTTLRPDFRAPVARRVVGLRSQFRVEALVWPLSEGIRTRHCHLRHRVSPTEPGDRCESASLLFHTGGATMCRRPPSAGPRGPTLRQQCAAGGAAPEKTTRVLDSPYDRHISHARDGAKLVARSHHVGSPRFYPLVGCARRGRRPN